MSRMFELIDRACSRVEAVVILGGMAVALLIGTAQVVLRYVFNAGFHWSEAFFVLFTVMAMLFAGARAVRDDRHVRVDVVSMLLPRRPKLAMRFVADLVAFALCGYFFYCGLRYVLFLNQMGTISPETELPDWIVYLLGPVTLGLFALRYIQALARTARGHAPQELGADATHLGGGS